MAINIGWRALRYVTSLIGPIPPILYFYERISTIKICLTEVDVILITLFYQSSIKMTFPREP